MASETISALLNRVWAAFRRAGITEDLRIIEYVAGLLLEQQGVALTANLPRRPSPGSEFNETEVKAWLEFAVEQAGSAAALFDRYVLFRLPEMLAGGRYPTPRHIVQLMVRLAECEGQHVADFACGSGGLLVYSNGGALTGIEISPEWSRLARANALLHGKEADIREGNALRAVQEGETFARILMNPPFGERVSSNYGTRSETALGTLALDHLSEGGRAALLAPTGLLFAGSQLEYNLRKKLVNDHHLEAVVSLPEDAFQPYSTQRTHLLLAHKAPPAEDALTWFLRPAFDGYISGRGRDLTEVPKTPNDLTLIERAVSALRQTLTESEFPFYFQMLTNDETLLGILIYPNSEANLTSARYLPEVRDKAGNVTKPKSLLLEVQDENKPAFWEIPFQVDTAPVAVEDAESIIRQRLGINKTDPVPTPDVFQYQSIRWGQSPTQRVGGILVKVYGEARPQLTGVAIPSAALQARGYALQPDDYLRAPEVSAALRHPHDILLGIHKTQRALVQRIDRLAAWLAPEKPKEYVIPAPVIEQQPFGSLSPIQQAIWDWIAGQKGENGFAQPFTLAQIEVACGEDEKRLALAIFAAMGLIVPITLKNLQNEQAMNFYRLAETNDLWSGALVETLENEAGEA
jgi:hypothetical protein